MGFWSGFEGLTGHRPGAFKGFSLKDILDEDLWKMHERLGGRQSRQFEETGVVPTTAWYKGMGRPEMMGPRVGGVGEKITSRNRANVPIPLRKAQPFTSPVRPEGALTAMPMMPRRQADVTTAAPYTDRAWAEISPVPKVPSPGGIPFGGKNPYRRPATLMDLPAGGRQRVPSLYDPYMFGLRQDQMGAAGFDPLTRRIQESKRVPEELSTAGQYRKGLQSAVGTLGDAFLPAGVMQQGREVWGDLRDFYYPGKDAPLFPTDKKTVIKRSAAPDVADTETTTITEKILGPSGHRMGALQDTAADMWKTIKEDDIIKYWMNQFRGN